MALFTETYLARGGAPSRKSHVNVARRPLFQFSIRPYRSKPREDKVRAQGGPSCPAKKMCTSPIHVILISCIRPICIPTDTDGRTARLEGESRLTVADVPAPAVDDTAAVGPAWVWKPRVRAGVHWGWRINIVITGVF